MDILGIDIVCVKNFEIIVLGVVFLVGFLVGYWESMDELKELNVIG